MQKQTFTLVVSMSTIPHQNVWVQFLAGLLTAGPCQCRHWAAATEQLSHTFGRHGLCSWLLASVLAPLCTIQTLNTPARRKALSSPRSVYLEPVALKVFLKQLPFPEFTVLQGTPGKLGSLQPASCFILDDIVLSEVRQKDKHSCPSVSVKH